MQMIGELATREVVTVTRGTSVQRAARMMREANVGSLIVVAGEKDARPVGIITDRDIVYELVALDLDADDITVGDLMSLDLVTVQHDADLSATLRVMGTQGIRRIPVLDDEGGLVGIFSLDDALQELTGQLEDILLMIRQQRRPGQGARAA